MLLEVNFLCFLLQSVWAQCTVLRAPEQQLRFPDSDSGPSAPLPGKTLSLRRLRPERWFSEGRAVFGKVISKQIYSSAEEEWN